MSEYLAPGVFVEEVSFRSKSIEGVGTSVCGMVGPTRFGPIRGTPEVLTSYGEFEKIFGDPQSLTFGSASRLNYTALAARAFFENGGKQLYMTRIISGGNDTDEYGSGGSAAVAATNTSGKIDFLARYPGSGGNLDLSVIWQDQESLFRSGSFNKLSDISNNAEGLLTIANMPKTFTGVVSHEDAKFPLKKIQVLAKKTADGFVFLAATKASVVNANDTVENKVNVSAFGTGIAAATFAALPFEFKQSSVIKPVTGSLADNTSAELVLNTDLDLTSHLITETDSLTRFRGTLNAAGSEFTKINTTPVVKPSLIIVSKGVEDLAIARSIPVRPVGNVTVSDLPAVGKITLNGADVTDVQVLTPDDLYDLKYDAPAVINARAKDKFVYALGDNTWEINITLLPETEVIPLAVFSAFPGAVKSVKLQRNFSLQAIRRKKTKTDTEGTPGVGEPVFITQVLSLDKNQPNFIGKVLDRNIEKTLDRLTIPIVCIVDDATPSQLLDDLYKLFIDEVGHGETLKKILNPDTRLDDPRHVILLAGGTDGDFPAAIDYAGEIDDKGATGFSALESVEDVSIVATPAAVIDASRHQAIAVEMEKHCVKMRYRFGLIDTREDMSLSEIQNFRNNFDNSRLALYAPWVVTSDPTGEKETINLPASGFMAGIYARTDVERGVHKAPANTPVFGALRFTQNINKFQQELLNPRGINCLRSFSGRGHQVWGGRTLSSDPEWKYVNVRRYFLYLERSIEKGTQWAVFEPNGERLWANVVTTIESFLFNEWKNGRLLGSKTSAAYFVRCDRTTMSQNDLDNGRLVCEVGVAPLTPAEFVIFRIGQKTADA